MLTPADNAEPGKPGPTHLELVPALRQEPVKTPGKRSACRVRGVPELHRVTADEIHRALAAPDFLPRRLLVRFLWVTGARIAEALAVTTQDFDFGASCVRLRTLKRRGEYFRVLPLPGAFCGQVAQWIAFARPGWEDPIFPWRRTQASEVVTRLLLAGGVDRRRAHPHAIRHGFAFHFLAHGGPVNVLQALMGHAFLSTTAIYTRATGADLRASYDRVPW